ATRDEPIKRAGPAVGSRVEAGGWSLAYLPDHEPALGADLRTMEDSWISGFGIARRADVLVHDCQYTVPEYEQRVGWGHSSTTDVVRFAERAEARRLVLFHHDPLHSDADLEGMLVDARDVGGAEGIDVELAFEGQAFART